MAFTTLTLVLIAFFLPVYGSEPIVDLGYSIYEGTSLSSGLNQFLGVRFAAPPIGDLRFRKPHPPSPTKVIQAATAFGPICFGVQGPFNTNSPRDGEDCLFLNVWAPSTATLSSKLPVFFFIGGGGYSFDFDVNVSPHDIRREIC